MAQAYTHGMWHAKAGKEDEFAAAWQAFAEWAFAEAPGAVGAVLIKDVEDPSLFWSFGPWASLDDARAFREVPGFADHIGRMEQLLESSSRHAGEERVRVGEIR